MKYYWPSIDAAFASLAWMPLGAFAVAWYAIGCASWIGLLWAMYRLMTRCSMPGDADRRWRGRRRWLRDC